MWREEASDNVLNVMRKGIQRRRSKSEGTYGFGRVTTKRGD